MATRIRFDNPENAYLMRSNVIAGTRGTDDFNFLALLHVTEVKSIPASTQSRQHRVVNTES